MAIAAARKLQATFGKSLRGIFPIRPTWSASQKPRTNLSGNQVTLPVGLGVGKTVKIGKMPIKIILEAEYAVIRPDDFGQEWNIVLQITPGIKSPFSKH